MNRVQRVIARALGLPQLTPEEFGAVTRGNAPLAMLLDRMRNALETNNRDWINQAHAAQYPTSVPVYTAVRLRADAVARGRLRVFRPNRSGKLEAMDDDFPVQRLLDRMNPWWTQADMLRAIETFLCLYGQAFLTIETMGTEDLEEWELWSQHPTRMQVVADRKLIDNQYIAGFLFDPTGVKKPLLPGEVIWWKYFNPLQEFAGLSPIAAGRLSIDMQKDMLKTNASLFKNGILIQNLAFLLKEPLLNEDRIDQFYERMAERHAGPENAGKPIISDLGEGSVMNLGMTNRDMEWMQGLHFSLEEVGRIFRVPPPLMFNQERAIYANVAAANQDFYQNTVTQEWNFLRQTFQERLIPALPQTFQRQRLQLGFDTSEVEALQGSRFEEVQSMALLMDRGVATINEAAELFGFEAKPWGDTWWQGFGLVPVGSGTPQDSGGTPTETDDAPPDDRGKSLESLLALPSPRGFASVAGFDPTDRRLPPAPHVKYHTAVRREVEIEDLELAAWTSFCRRLERADEPVVQMMQDIFKSQQEDILSKVRANFTRRINADGLFIPNDWIEFMRVAATPVLGQILQGNANAQITEFSLGIDFDLSRPITQAWIDQRTLFWAERANEETAGLLIETLEESNFIGESIPQIQTRIEEVFEFNDEIRSERIARTETTAYANQGHIEAYAQAEIEEKQWLTSLDGRERSIHRDAHRQIVALRQPFLVGGESLMAPGQGGSARNVVNCRCTTLPVLG